MSIVTKKGDKGKTCLCRGRRVSKDHIRVEACGSLDELCSYLGASRVLVKKKKIKSMIEEIQQDLFVIGREIAAETQFISKINKRINKAFINKLESYIKNLEDKRIVKQECFCLPGSSLTSSFLDISRTIARKLERRAVTLRRRKMLKNNCILVYLNRLSDLLYLLARYTGERSEP